jgi:hypothetical protein
LNRLRLACFSGGTVSANDEKKRGSGLKLLNFLASVMVLGIFLEFSAKVKLKSNFRQRVGL